MKETSQSIIDNIKKLLSYLTLPKGWNYGEGVPTSKQATEMAVDILQTLIFNDYYNIDSAPGNEGEIEFAATKDDFSYSIIIEQNLSISLYVSNGDTDVFDLDYVDFDTALKHLKESTQYQICRGFELPTRNTIFQKKEDSHLWPLTLAPTELASQSYSKNAYSEKESRYASIYETGIANRQENRLYSGDSKETSQFLEAV